VATIDNVSVDLMVVLGTTRMPIHQVMRLSRGAIIELDATEQDEVKVLANNLPVASGAVVVNRNRAGRRCQSLSGLKTPVLKALLQEFEIVGRAGASPCPGMIHLLHRRP